MRDQTKPESYRIHELRAENFKRLTAVTIRPDGNVIQITGRNGQGKTSALDAIVAAIGGKKHIQKRPIQIGKNEAKIELDLGDLIVTRTFKVAEDGSGDEFTTHVRVEAKDGRSFKSPQAVLDDLMGDLAFDPLEFTRLDPKAQFNILKSFVPEIDFDELALHDKSDREDRTIVGRRQREQEAAMRAIDVPSNTPTQLIDESKLIDAIRQADLTNSEIDSRADRRATAQTQIDGMMREAEQLRSRAVELETRAIALQNKLDEAEELPEKISVDRLTQQLNAARHANENIRLAIKRMEHKNAAVAAEEEYLALTAQIEQRERDKNDAIAKADLPVKALSFGLDAILMNGLPFDQASAAEQIRVSTAIAMALNPKLKVILIRDGSLLDKDSLLLLSDIAEKNNYQVFLERVATGEKIGIVIENGEIVS